MIEAEKEKMFLYLIIRSDQGFSEILISVERFVVVSLMIS